MQKTLREELDPKAVAAHAEWAAYPILPCNLCGSQSGLRREAIEGPQVLLQALVTCGCLRSRRAPFLGPACCEPALRLLP